MRFTVLVLVLMFLLSSCTEERPPTIIVETNDHTYAPQNVRPVLDEWQQKTFNYFYEGASAQTGMALEGNQRGDVVTTGGSGFGLMALIVGAERGWISRQQAAEQTRKIVRFLGAAERFNGMWSHWYNPDGTAHPFGNQIKTGDLVESAFMAAGLLTAFEYYNLSSPLESEIRDSVESFWGTMNWQFYTGSKNVLHWLWYSLDNQLELEVRGWNETWIAYILALAAPAGNAISTDVYQQGWLRNGGIAHPGRSFYGYELPFGEEKGGPLFFAHYSFLGLNPADIEDSHASYWQQNVAHTLINRHYCIEDAPGEFAYDEKNWGLTACYGAKPPLWDYKARSPINDDGVIAPTAALGSYPYTPFYSTQVLLQLAQNPLVHGEYGFADAYAPVTKTSEKKHLAIDQGPIVVMIENYRSGLIWNLLMRNEHIKRGLKLAGVKDMPDYSNGFYRAVVNTKTSEYDMMRHPDRETYEIDYFLEKGGEARFLLLNDDALTVRDTLIDAVAGKNTFRFNNANIKNGKRYTLKLFAPDNVEHALLVRLR